MANKGTWTFQFESNVGGVLSAKERAVLRALEKMGGTAETHAKKLCPVDTGRLRASITHKYAGEETELVGTNVDYAPYVELGHNQEVGRYVPAIGKRLVASHVEGKPFIRPAVEDHAAEYKKIAEDELRHA